MALRPCRECGAQISTAANACPHCGCKRRNAGISDGILACVFGVLGIFTMLGIIFVPLAALFSLGALVGGLFGKKTLSGSSFDWSSFSLKLGRQERNATAVSLGLVGSFLTIVGFVVSPSLWLLAAGLMGAAHHDESATSAVPASTDQQVQETGYDKKPAAQSQISCGSSGCIPMYDTDASRVAAAEANAGNAREGTALVPKTTQDVYDKSLRQCLEDRTEEDAKAALPDCQQDARRRGATAFVVELLRRWSTLDNSVLSSLGDAYADQVSYYGKPTTRQAVVDDKVRFATRWPDRKYQLRPGSLVASSRASIIYVHGRWHCGLAGEQSCTRSHKFR